jgi:hypothetical protein
MERKKIFKKANAVSEPDDGKEQNLAKVKRIRARASYRLFAELHDFLDNKPDTVDILVKLYDVLNDKRSFGSARNARFAAESLGWVLKDRDGTSDKILGNFHLGDCFADVRCLFGHDVRLFNIGRGHFYACDTCQTYIFVGSNLMSGWREENEDIWRENSDSLEGYTFIERGKSDV